MKSEPTYFVQTTDGKLHAYWRLDILLCDLSLNGEKSVTVLQKDSGGFTLSYSPVSTAELRKAVA